MKNIAYCFLFILILVNIGKINSKQEKFDIFHPLKLQIDFSNMPNNDDNNIKSLISEASNILSKLIFTNNKEKLRTDSKVMSKCKQDLSFNFISKSDIDIIIYPILEKMKKNYSIKFCNVHKNQMPSLVLLTINQDLTLISDNEIVNAKNELLMNLIKILIDCLGLDKQYLKKKKFLRNNFFATPYYLMDGYDKSFKSIKKLYTLSGEKIPKKNISLNGNFYLSPWRSDFITKNFVNKNIDINVDFTESIMNLFNDIEFYSLPIFDYQYIGNKNNSHCYRVDQKCLNETELKKYYIHYGLNTNKNNEIVCYLSNSDNIKQNQCGTKYSYLIDEKNDFCPLIKKNKRKEKKIKMNTVPDLIYHNNQTLTLLKPSSKCKNLSPRTIYFKTFQREENLSDKYKIETIFLGKKDKKYFATYLTLEEIYYKNFVNILEKNGIIRSYYQNNNHNLYIKTFNNNFFLTNNKKGDYLNDYQKMYHFMGVEEYFYKNLLYKNYLYMKSYYKAYNYMPTTYIYPKDAEKIEKKFRNYKLSIKNLWIVKPINMASGIGIHLFRSLEEEMKNNRKEFLISKYYGTPHLIKEKKYDMRIYVLVTGFQPLRVYLYNEGLIRIAADKYKLNIDSLDNIYSHLTNTAINVKNKKYKNPKSEMDESANKWNFKTYRNYLKKKNLDVDLLFENIKDIIIKTLISGSRKIVNTTEQLKLNDINMFNLFGFDIFVDINLKPYLLEVNTRPFLDDYNKYDKIIKSNLFVDTLNLVGIYLYSHDKEGKPFDKVFSYKSEIQKRVDDALCELTRPRGDYELIFPLKDNIDKYKKFFMKKKGKENTLFWKEILQDK